MSKCHRVFLVRFNGRSDNPGDMLIFDSLVGMLEAYGCVLSYDAVPWSRHQVPVVQRGALVSLWIKALLSRFSQRPVEIIFVYPPGAVIGPWGANSPTGTLARLKKGLKDFLWALVQPSSVLLGASCYNPNYLKGCRLDAIGLRDDDSLDAFSSVSESKIVYFPDLSLAVTPRKEPGPKSRAFLSFRGSFPEGGMPGQYAGSLRKTVGELAPMLRQKCQGGMLFFTQVPEDTDFTRELWSACSGEESHWSDTFHYQDLLEQYASAELVISNRLHVLLVGALAGALPIALTSGKHRKIVSLFKKLGLDALLLPMDPSEASGRLEAILASRTDLLEQVQQSIRRERATLTQTLEGLFR